MPHAPSPTDLHCSSLHSQHHPTKRDPKPNTQGPSLYV